MKNMNFEQSYYNTIYICMWIWAQQYPSHTKIDKMIQWYLNSLKLKQQNKQCHKVMQRHFVAIISPKHTKKTQNLVNYTVTITDCLLGHITSCYVLKKTNKNSSKLYIALAPI